ncbi:MAG: hypothetical protein ACLU30_20330 [Odoribacter splanchnicus]
MKTQKIIFFLLLLTGLLYSCYEDKSSLNYTLINPINIELGDESTDYSVFAYDTLEIKPIVYKEGVDDADLSYRWTISELHPSYLTRYDDDPESPDRPATSKYCLQPVV